MKRMDYGYFKQLNSIIMKCVFIGAGGKLH